MDGSYVKEEVRHDKQENVVAPAKPPSHDRRRQLEGMILRRLRDLQAQVPPGIEASRPNNSSVQARSIRLGAVEEFRASPALQHVHRPCCTRRRPARRRSTCPEPAWLRKPAVPATPCFLRELGRDRCNPRPRSGRGSSRVSSFRRLKMARDRSELRGPRHVRRAGRHVAQMVMNVGHRFDNRTLSSGLCNALTKNYPE